MLLWKKHHKLSLGFARRPGRQTFKKACAGICIYARRPKNATHRFPRCCADVLYAVCPCNCRCVRKLGPGIDHDRTTAAQPSKVPKVRNELPSKLSQVLAFTFITHPTRNPRQNSKSVRISACFFLNCARYSQQLIKRYNPDLY